MSILTSSMLACDPCPDPTPFKAKDSLVANEIENIIQDHPEVSRQCETACKRVSGQPIIHTFDNCELEIFAAYLNGELAPGDEAAIVTCSGTSSRDCR